MDNGPGTLADMDLDTSRRSNADIAARIGISVSGVSRLRAGARRPSYDTMKAIAREYGWKVGDQAEAVAAGIFPQEFELRMSPEMDPDGVGLANASASR